MSQALTIQDKCDSETIATVEKFLRFLKVDKRYSLHTVNSYRIDIFYFLDFLFKFRQQIISKNSLESLTVHDFRRWLGERLEDHINSSNARAISSLRSFFKFCNQNHLISNDQIKKIRTPKVAKPIPKAVEKIDIDKILAEIVKVRKDRKKLQIEISLAQYLFHSLLKAKSSDLDWHYFNERNYIDGKALKTGDDPYVKNKFNQVSIGTNI